MDEVLLVDKPAGKTSHDVVAAVRHDHREVKVGHAGTLDPFATGLLLVLLGRATRVQRFLMALPKTYEAVARFGAVSSTGDPEGEIVATGAPVPDPLVLPTGPVRQRPPAYSAVKVGGERAYRLARRGEEVEVPERDVTVYAARELWREEPRVAIELECSAGTYVRSYVAALGDAYCEELRRTRIGPFEVAHAGERIALGDALGAVMEVRRVEGEMARQAAHGVAVAGEASAHVLLVDDDGPIAIVEPREGGLLKPTVGFRAGMKVTLLSEIEPRPRRVAVGTFDGVHRGHREVIAGNDTVLTFDPHPIAVVRPDAVPRLLTGLDRKAELIAGLGVEELVVIPFDREFASRSAQEFVDDVLVGALGATHVSVGENFRFGHKAQGDAAMLRADERFATDVQPLIEVGDEIVSSSHIRGLVLGGHVEEANPLLVDPFQFRGEVAHGDKRGRELGFPTANLVPDPRLVTPGHGVYACRAGIVGPDAEAWWTAAVNVGIRPQFDTGRGELIEAYLLDFEGDIYGQELRIEFHRRLRGERRFADVEALLRQMEKDVEDARRLLRFPAA